MVRVELERKALDRAEAIISCPLRFRDIERKTQKLVTTLREEEERRQELEQFAADKILRWVQAHGLGCSKYSSLWQFSFGLFSL